MPSAWHNSAGPEHSSRICSRPRCICIALIPSSGSAARRRTAVPSPARPVTTFMQKCMP